jgi:hypothetical protein
MKKKTLAGLMVIAIVSTAIGGTLAYMFLNPAPAKSSNLTMTYYAYPAVIDKNGYATVTLAVRFVDNSYFPISWSAQNTRQLMLQIYDTGSSYVYCGFQGANSWTNPDKLLNDLSFTLTYDNPQYYNLTFIEGSYWEPLKSVVSFNLVFADGYSTATSMYTTSSGIMTLDSNLWAATLIQSAEPFNYYSTPQEPVITPTPLPSTTPSTSQNSVAYSATLLRDMSYDNVRETYIPYQGYWMIFSIEPPAFYDGIHHTNYFGWLTGYVNIKYLTVQETWETISIELNRLHEPTRYSFALPNYQVEPNIDWNCENTSVGTQLNSFGFTQETTLATIKINFNSGPVTSTTMPTTAPLPTPTPSAISSSTPSPTLNPTPYTSPTPKPTATSSPTPTPSPTPIIGHTLTYSFTITISNTSIPNGQNATVYASCMQSGDTSRLEQIVTITYTGNQTANNCGVNINGYYAYDLGTMQPSQQVSVPTYYSCIRSNGTPFSQGINVVNTNGISATGYVLP